MIFECSYYRFNDENWESNVSIPITTNLQANHSFELVQTSVITQNETSLSIEFTCQLDLQIEDVKLPVFRNSSTDSTQMQYGEIIRNIFDEDPVPMSITVLVERNNTLDSE